MHDTEIYCACNRADIPVEAADTPADAAAQAAMARENAPGNIADGAVIAGEPLPAEVGEGEVRNVADDPVPQPPQQADGSPARTPRSPVPYPPPDSPHIRQHKHVRRVKPAVSDIDISSGSLPVMHIVLLDGVVKVYSDPTNRSPAYKTLKKGTLLLVLFNVQGEEGRWFKVADGWVPETIQTETGRFEAVVPLLRPKATASTQSSDSSIQKPPSPRPSSASSDKFYSRAHFLLRYEQHEALSPKSVPTISAAKPSPIVPMDFPMTPNAPSSSGQASPNSRHSGTSSDRLEQIMALQAQLRGLTQQMTVMNETMLQCHAKINQLTKGL